MEVRKATPEDIDTILAIYRRAREYMRKTGNPNQWKTTNPPKETLVRDIAQGNLYLLTDKDGIQGVFAMIPGEDPTYGYIEGSWINDAPYAAIHRVASAGSKRGILPACLRYCSQHFGNLRIDTHQDNRIMQHLLEKHGFTRCGLIYLENGEPRIAYHRVSC